MERIKHKFIVMHCAFTVSTSYSYEDVNTSDGTWKGFEGVASNTFEADPTEIENFTATPNALLLQTLREILKPEDLLLIFHFDVNN